MYQIAIQYFYSVQHYVPLIQKCNNKLYVIFMIINSSYFMIIYKLMLRDNQAFLLYFYHLLPTSYTKIQFKNNIKK